MLNAGVEVVVEDGGLPDAARVAQATGLNGEVKIYEIRRGCCAGIFDAEPWVTGCGPRIGVLTWEKRSEISRCGYRFCEDGGEEWYYCEKRGNDRLARHVSKVDTELMNRGFTLGWLEKFGDKKRGSPRLIIT